MAGFFHKGILLQQRKEPALSRDLREFLNGDTMGLRMDCPPIENPDEIAYGEIINYSRMANIIDERDGMLLADKLIGARRRKVRLVIVDAVDDEPYISSQLNPILKNTQLASDGLSFCQRACNAAHAYFTVYKNLTDLDIRIPRHIGNYVVVRLHGRYPAEYQASQDYIKDDGVLVVGSGAILHLARAILFRKPQTTAFVTVAGDCIGNPTNLEVSLGMTVTQTLERCGLIDDPHRVVVGGSMTGISVIDTDKTLVTPTTRAILAFRENIKTLGLSCIGCVRCVHVCPEGLNPFFLYNSVKQHRYDMFKDLDAQMCVGCGTCSYMCPAKLDLSETIYQAAVSFHPHMVAMNNTAILDKKRDEADYQRFYDDYALGKAIFKHSLVRLKLYSEFYSTSRVAMRIRKSAEKSSNAFLRQAKQKHSLALRTADIALKEAKQLSDDSLTQAIREVKEKEKALTKMIRDTRYILEKARLIGNTAEAASCQNILAVLREHRRLGDYEQVAVQSRKCAAIAVKRAHIAFDGAASLCHERVTQAEQALAKAKKMVEQRKEEISFEYKASQTLYETAKQQADVDLQQAIEFVKAQKIDTSKAWIEATKDYRPAAMETLREADCILQQAREKALNSAQASAIADAAVTGRAVRTSDLRPPIKLAKCKKELLHGHWLLALAMADEQGEEVLL